MPESIPPFFISPRNIWREGDIRNGHKKSRPIGFGDGETPLRNNHHGGLPALLPGRGGGIFLDHHSNENIAKDIGCNSVFLCVDAQANPVGTVTIKGNEISRLFVLPEQQGKGYGTSMLDFAERLISRQYGEIVLDASLPAKRLYLKRGYQDMEFHILPTSRHDFLCYDVMVKRM